MDIKAFIFLIGALCVFYALWIIYARLAYRDQKPDDLGRITMTPGIMSWLMALVSAAFFALFSVMIAQAAMGIGDDQIFWFLLGPPLTALMGFSVYIISWSRLRVSSEQVEYRGLRGWEVFEWDRVVCVEHHAGLGNRLQITGRRPQYFWGYGYGVQETKAIFDSKDKPFVVG